ncbi:hypothetical protein, partial [Paenibacillus ehimensis]
MAAEDGCRTKMKSGPQAEMRPFAGNDGRWNMGCFFTGNTLQWGSYNLCCSTFFYEIHTISTNISFLYY